MPNKKLIPAILAENPEQLQSKIRQVEDYTENIQIDLMDGNFVPQKSKFTPQDLHKINPAVSQELHMMVEHPEAQIEKWIKAGVEKFILHTESKTDWKIINEIYLENSIKIYLALNPDSPVKALDNKLGKIDGVTIMGVYPGKSNQQFQPKVLGKIKSLRNRFPNLSIQVDGGMHLRPKNTINQVLIAGANEIVAGSEIFLSKDIYHKIDELEYIIKNYQ